MQSYEPADPHLLLTLTLTHPLSSVLRVSACQGPATNYIETDFSVDNWNETGIFHHPSCSFGFGSQYHLTPEWDSGKLLAHSCLMKCRAHSVSG